MAPVRYIVRDVDEAVHFYSTVLGFHLDRQFGPAMAILTRADLTLWVAGPASSAAQPMPDGRTPEPGGWNRFVLEVGDLAPLVMELRRTGIRLRSEVVKGPGGRQIVCEDPSGNPIELFQPA
ncbi:MAG: VOC family protein [Thermoplasmata archaeon]|nr:VOC family protein [Thermoplasmata archaeon]